MNRNGLSVVGAGSCALPVAWMGPSPLLDACDLIGSAEGVAVAVLAEPAALAGGLAGLAAVRLGAVALAVCGARIREEELTATKALAATWPTAHWDPKGPGTEEGRKPKKSGEEEDARRRRKKGFGRKSWKKTPPKKTDF